MSDWIDMRVNVLASSPEEISKIQTALQHLPEGLLAWVVQAMETTPKLLVEKVLKDITFRPSENVEFADTSVEKECRLENAWPYYAYGVVWSHLYLVSRDFFHATFLVEYCDAGRSFAGRVVLLGGHEIRSVHDGKQQTQGSEWVLPDIFAPYRAEHHRGAEFGSLWDGWLIEMQGAVTKLRERYCAHEESEEQECSKVNGHKIVFS